MHLHTSFYLTAILLSALDLLLSISLCLGSRLSAIIEITLGGQLAVRPWGAPGHPSNACPLLPITHHQVSKMMGAGMGRKWCSMPGGFPLQGNFQKRAPPHDCPEARIAKGHGCRFKCCAQLPPAEKKWWMAFKLCQTAIFLPFAKRSKITA